MNVLEVKHLNKSYKDFELKDVSFTLPKGYIMGYVGQNGAGKTTTINLITNICNASSGEVMVDGIRYEEDPIRYKEQIAFIGDESYFPKEITIKEIRTILRDFYRSFREEEFNQLIKRWKLPEKKKIAEFSRGMKVKLMFAVALSRDTKLLVLDEATNGLDPIMRADILKILQEYIADGEKSILFSTHMLEDLESIADYIVFIDDGSILINETKDDLLESYVLVIGDKALLSGELRKNLIGIIEQEYGFQAILPSEKAGLLSKSYVIEKPSIDQIMIHCIRNKEGRR